MKCLLLSLIFVYSCGGNMSASLSPDQKGLCDLSDQLKEDLKEANDTVSREQLIQNYQLKLHRYLSYTCDSSLKNIKVRMTRLQEGPNGILHAEFRDSNCIYVFHQVYESTRQMKADLFYRMVKSFQQGIDLKLRFLYTGGVKIMDPTGDPSCLFQIHVIPTAVIS